MPKSRFVRVGLLGVAVAVGGWTLAPATTDGSGRIGADGVGAAVQGAELDAFLERAFDDLGLVPGMAVAVVRDTSVLLARGYGVADVSSGAPVTSRTPFYIASSTKSFTGTAAAILDERGTWSLDDPLSRWLPELSLPAPLSTDGITIRDLLTHRSRIDNGSVVFRTAYSGEHDRATLLRLLSESDVLDPGFDYGNIGYVVAGLAMESAAGDWKRVLDREIFTPLRMVQTSAFRSEIAPESLALPHGVGVEHQPFEIRPYIKVDANMHAAGGIITTAADLGRWLEAMLNDGRVDGEQVLPARAVRESHRLQTTTDARFHAFRRTGYGLGWYHSIYEGDLVLHHFGNYPGFRAHVSFMPEHGIGVAVLTNESAQGYFVPEFIATMVYDRLLGRADLRTRYDTAAAFLRSDAARIRTAIRDDDRRRASRPDTLAPPPEVYTGTYTSPRGGTMIIEESATRRLRARIGTLESLIVPINAHDQLRVELVPGSGDVLQMFINDGPADSLSYRNTVFRRDPRPASFP